MTGSHLVGQVAEEVYFSDCEGFSVPYRKQCGPHSMGPRKLKDLKSHEGVLKQEKH